MEEVAIVRGAGILEVARLGPSGSLETQVVKKASGDLPQKHLPELGPC